MNKNRIPTVIGITLLIIGLAAGVFLVKNAQLFRLGATTEAAPKDVRITNITENSFSISWATQKAVLGFVSWGETSSSLGKTEVDEFENPSFTHTLSIKSLTPEKTYYFKINSGGTEYDNNGTPWLIKTGSILTTSARTLTISGSILTAAGQPAENALVYVTVGGGSPLSTTTSKSGSWVLSLSSARNQNLTAPVLIDDKSTLLEISVNAGPDGVASAQIYPQSAKPVPAITLGQTLNFKALPPSPESGIPTAEIGLPEESTPSSGFNLGTEETAAPSAKAVTLDSISNGEVVSTNKPEFFGAGPKGTTLTVTVESEVITGEITVPVSGEWTWSPPSNLAPGSHKITIQWRDAAGILRSLTRTFVVEASGAPAFTSTPSATPTTRLTPTPTSSPSATPTKTTTPSATPTQYATPESGSLTPTILLFIMGVSVIIFASLVWRKSEI